MGWLRGTGSKMQTVTVETAFGPIEWTARPDVFGASGPVLLVIRGAFADPDSLSHLPECVDIDCVLANLPGHSSPPVVANTVGVFAAAFREAIQKAFLDRPTIVLGLSIGGLVAMALRLPQIRRLVLVDPPLSTDLPAMTWRIRTQLPNHADFCWQVFGVSDTAQEPRSYAGLLDALKTPSDVLLGGVHEDSDTIPCLNAADAYKGHPFVHRHIIPWAGHNIPAQAPDEFMHVVERACASVLEAV